MRKQPKRNFKELNASENVNLESVAILEKEQRLRISSSVLFIVAFYNSDDPAFCADYLGNFLFNSIDPKFKAEELCLKSFRLSLDLAILPIKKFLLLYYLYLRILFGGAPNHTVPPVRIINKEFYMKEFKIREQAKIKSPIEDFYVRNNKITNVEKACYKGKCDTSIIYCCSFESSSYYLSEFV